VESHCAKPDRLGLHRTLLEVEMYVSLPRSGPRRDDAGRPVATGTYFVRLRTEYSVRSSTVLMLK